MTNEEKALKLWQRFMQEIREPYEMTEEWLPASCFFCQEDEDDPHADDCIYALAKQLVEASGIKIEIPKVRQRYSMNVMPSREGSYSSQLVNVFHDNEFLCHGYVAEGTSWIFVNHPEGNFIPTHWEYQSESSGVIATHG